ncbi:MAG: radical SAM family heme chaperone HemW [Pseudomonadota bacterium]
MTLPLALYIHWPFCKSKCPYCDFNSYVRDGIDQSAWRQAYLEELRFYRQKTGPRRIASVFFGGGTPSLMEPETVAAVIGEADRLWGLPDGTEITLEANPTSAEADSLRDFRAAGVNRVSLGVQSLRDDALKKLGRQHSAAEAVSAVRAAARIFDRYSFDLIYARPGQSVADWERELGEALEYAGGHMSLYQLTIEEGSAWHALYRKGGLKLPDENAAADMFELTQRKMEDKGLPAYEISNHARAGEESRHNLVYWRYGDYAGIGPGAHGRLTLDGGKWATCAHKIPELWIKLVKDQGHGSHPFELIDFFGRGQEMLMMGLRLREGFSLDDFQKETQTPLQQFVNPQILRGLLDEGLLELTNRHIRATAAGRQRLNAVLALLAPR